MFLELAHTKLDIFKASRELTLSCYKHTSGFPSDEKFGMSSQIRRAALSVYLNIAEGCSRRSVSERKRFYEIARGSLIEVDTAFDLATSLKYTCNEEIAELGILVKRCFQMLSKMIGA